MYPYFFTKISENSEKSRVVGKYIEIYKMYFNLNDKDNIKEYSTILLEKYKITNEALKEIETEAINDIILRQQRSF